MKVSLFQFQEKALNNLRINASEAIGSYQRTNTSQVISFTAPTGSGKTIIMTSFIESVLFGDEIYPEQPDAIFVWLSDSPELNEQSKLKIETKADKIRIGQCVTISDENFDKEFLEDGHIYFLNTQKIGKDKNLSKKGDNRTYTIWETLRNTAFTKNNRLYFIIDEAHRGMQGREAGRATTIMQKFIKGSEKDNLLPMPLVIGMSATSERFNALVEGTSSTIHKVIVSPDEVRSSGLLKDRIVISYSEESSINKSMAVLQAAAEDWKNKWKHWTQYCYEQHYAHVNPIFLIQVENKAGNEISATNLDECLKNIEERSGFKFERGEVIHSFGDTNSSIVISGLEVPYEEPSRIQDNKKIKVVFFKESLSTGWDCPRAETMMSFRTAKDATYIAQLLGRMVRTPMQMHIQVDDTLNEVNLFLPFFDKQTVEDVIKALQTEEGGTIPTDIYGEAIENKKLETLTVRPKPKKIFVKKQLPEQQEVKYQEKDNSFIDYESSINSCSKENNNLDNNDENIELDSTIKLNTMINNENNINQNNKIYTFKKNLTDHGKINIDGDYDYNNEPESKIEDLKEEETNLPIINREEIVKAINDSGLLTYDVRTTRINNYLKSMFSLARLLNQTGMDTSILGKVRDDIVKMIYNYIFDLKAQGIYSDLVLKAKEFKLASQAFDVFGKNISSSYDENSLFTTEVDIDRQFNKAEMILGSEGISNNYLIAYQNLNDLIDLKVEVILFASDTNCISFLNNYAKSKYHELNDRYRRYMVKLTESYRRQYDRIVSDGDVTSKHNLRLPETITIAHDNNGKKYYNHLYVNDDGYAKIRLNDWELGVLEEESKREDFVCWLRNPPRASWSLCIPYEINGESKPTYPDFIIVRKDPIILDGFIFDVLEPHSPSFSDNLGKAKGFAEYARQNPGVGRIELIRKIKDSAKNEHFLRLDLSMSAVRDKVSKAMNDEELNHIFDTEGKFE